MEQKLNGFRSFWIIGIECENICSISLKRIIIAAADLRFLYTFRE